MIIIGRARPQPRRSRHTRLFLGQSFLLAVSAVQFCRQSAVLSRFPRDVRRLVGCRSPCLRAVPGHDGRLDTIWGQPINSNK